MPLPVAKLIIVSGVAGSGKTTAAEQLRVVTSPPVVVLDVDSLIYRRKNIEDFTGDWIRIAFEVACSGGYPVLVGDLDPSLLNRLDASTLFSEIHIGVIDVPAEVLMERLHGRPQWRGWTQARIRNEVARARNLRQQVETVFRGARAPQDIAATIADWINLLTYP